jgi:hypothetical protein
MFNKKDKNQDLVQKLIEKLKSHHIKIIVAEYGTDEIFTNYFKGVNDFNTISTGFQNIKSEKDLAHLLGVNIINKKFLVNEATALSISNNLIKNNNADIAIGIVFDKENNYAALGMTTNSKATKLVHNYTNCFTVKPAFLNETYAKITGDDSALEINLMEQLLEKGFNLLLDLV